MKHNDVNLLIDEVKNGDTIAFSKLYFYYKPISLCYARKLLNCLDDAENAVQIMFIKIWEHRHQIQPDRNFQSYLLKILRNVINDHYKKISREHSILMCVAATQDTTDEKGLDKEDLYNKLSFAISDLPSKRRNILKLNLLGKSYDEIAQKTATSKNTVRNQLVKAKKVLRNELLYNYTRA